MQIGELSDRTGRSVHALRYYESLGLMPGVHRDSGGRRQYTARHVDWVGLLGRLRRTRMSLEQVQHYAELVEQGDDTLAERQELLREHRARVLDQIEDFHRSIELLDYKIDLYGKWRTQGGSPIEFTTPA